MFPEPAPFQVSTTLEPGLRSVKAGSVLRFDIVFFAALGYQALNFRREGGGG